MHNARTLKITNTCFEMHDDGESVGATRSLIKVTYLGQY